MGASTGGIVRRPCVILQRVTSSDQSKRLIGAPVPEKLRREFGGVVGENHTVFLEQSGAKAKLAPRKLADVLRSKIIDRLFRCISGSVNVSVYELNQLPMPDPEVLVKTLGEGQAIDAAVLAAFVAALTPGQCNV